MSCVSAPSLRPLSLHSPEHDCPLCEALGVGVFAYRALAEELGSDDPTRLDPIWRERCQARVDAYNQRLRVDAELRDRRDESAAAGATSHTPGSLEQLCLSTDGLWTLGRVARITRESLRLTRSLRRWPGSPTAPCATSRRGAIAPETAACSRCSTR